MPHSNSIGFALSRAETRGVTSSNVNGIAAGSATSGHTVLAAADGSAYRSLRQRPMTRAERYALGKGLRERVPRRSLADWTPPADRPDPIQQIMVSHQGRVDRLIPVRVGRMIASPYGFLRGTAVVMAEDVARLPPRVSPRSSAVTPTWAIGFYASPERDLVIDLNDFDEAHPGGWEWDLRRLVASIWVAGRQNGASEEQCGTSARSLSSPTARSCAGWPTAALFALLRPPGRRPTGR